MKKTLLLSLAGIMAVGSAFALPDRGDRQTRCEKHPDTLVWVEKNGACIPLNACESDDESIKKAYCLDVTVNTFQPYQDEDWKTVVQRYAEKVLRTSVVDDLININNAYVGAKTKDGGYFVVKLDRPAVSYAQVVVSNAATAYGYKDVMVNMNTDGTVSGYTILGTNKTDCEDIADFATLLSDAIINAEYTRDRCVITPIGTPRKGLVTAGKLTSRVIED